MSHDMSSKDRAAYVGQPAWHGLGIVLPETCDPITALGLAGITPTVGEGEVLIRYRVPGVDADGLPKWDVRTVEAPQWKATMNPETHDVYGIVGKDFSATDPQTLCRLALEVGGKDVETIGTFRDQRYFYLLVRLGDAFTVHDDKDELHPFGLLTTAHDGTGALVCCPTTVRVVCRNTYAMALGRSEGGAELRMRHTGGIMERMDEVKRTLSIGRAQAAQMAEEARKMAAHPMKDAEVQAYFGAVYATTYGALPEGEYKRMGKGEKAKVTRAAKMVETWTRTLMEERERLELSDATAFLAANAITQWSDHERTVRSSRNGPADRTYSNVLGTSAAFKRNVYAAAREVVGIAD